jgi:hypothetical protein
MNEFDTILHRIQIHLRLAEQAHHIAEFDSHIQYVQDLQKRLRRLRMQQAGFFQRLWLMVTA